MSLRAFLEKMEEEGDVVHVTSKVSPRYRMASILQAFSDGPVLFFESE